MMKFNISLKDVIFVTLTLLIFFFSTLILAPFTCAESPCWNDGTIRTVNVIGSKVDKDGQANFRKPGTKEVDDPVNVASGNYSYEATDLTIPSVGIPLELKRIYNSQDAYEGPLGIGTSHNYNLYLVEAEDQGIYYKIIRRPQGRKDRFIEVSPNTYTSPEAVFDTLFKDDQGYYLQTKDKTIYRFNNKGRLSTITDRNLNQQTLTYDTKGKLIQITDSFNRWLNLTYTDKNKVSQLTDQNNRTYNYTYDNKNLITVTIPSTTEHPNGLTTTYTYNDFHKLISITDPKQQTYLTI